MPSIKSAAVTISAESSRWYVQCNGKLVQRNCEKVFLWSLRNGTDSSGTVEQRRVRPQTIAVMTAEV